MPARDFIVQGALVAVLLPVVCVGMSLLFAGGTDPELLGPILAVLGGGGSLVAIVAGGVMIALSGRSSARTRVILRDDGGFVLADGRALARADIRSLRVAQPNPMMKWVGVIASTGSGDVVILGRVPPARGKQVAALTVWLGEILGVPADTAVAATGMGMNPNTAAALCYLPFQGIWLIFSIWSLIAAKDERVRFAARQSLVFYGASAFGIVLLVVAIGVPTALAGEGALQMGLAALLGISLLVATFGRLAIGLVAAWRAYHGRDWSIPGLGWLARDAGGSAPESEWKPPVAG